MKEFMVNFAFSVLLQLLKAMEPALLTMFQAAFAKLYLAIERAFDDAPEFWSKIVIARADKGDDAKHEAGK